MSELRVFGSSIWMDILVDICAGLCAAVRVAVAVALGVGVPLACLYALVRFVKWAWIG